MTKIAVIIPSRLSAERLPNKPLSLINNKEMIINISKITTRNKEMTIISEEIAIKLGKVSKSMILHLSAIGKCCVKDF